MRLPNNTLLQGSPDPRRQEKTAAFPPVPAARRPGRRLADDLDEPTSIRSESAWFEPAVEPGRRLPIGHEWEERKGWRPPSSSQGLVFAGVSFVLIGAAIAGTILFLIPEPPAPHHATTTPPAEISMPTTTGADVGSASAAPSAAAAAPPSATHLGDNVEPPPQTKAPAAPPPAPHAATPRPAPHRVADTPDRGLDRGRRGVPDTPARAPAEPTPPRPPERTEKTDLFDTPSGLDEPKAAPTTSAPAPRTDPSSQF